MNLPPFNLGRTTDYNITTIESYLSLKKSKQKSPGRATSSSRSQPLTPGGREQVTHINVCIASKQSKVIKTLKGQKKHIDKDQGKTKYEAPRSVNNRATQNKNNIGTTALERSVVYTNRGGG